MIVDLLENLREFLQEQGPATPALIKLILFFCVWFGAWLPLGVIVAVALKWRPPQPLGEKKLPLLASVYLIVPFILWGVSQVEHQSFGDWGLTWEPQLFLSTGWGFFLGVLGFAILFSLQALFGWIQWQGDSRKIWQQWPSILLTLVIGLWISGTEELVFRGFLQTLLQQDYSQIIAAMLVSAIFAVAHLIWEQKDTLPQLPGLWLMGMILVWARVCNHNSLGLAIGLHAGWIWCIAGLDMTQSIRYTGRVSEWITGAVTKPLAGISGLLLLLATAGVLAISFII